MPAESPAEHAYSVSFSNLGTQRSSLDNLRARAASVVTGASVVAAFLGSQALADVRITDRGTAVPDRGVQAFELVGFAGFVGCLLCCALVLAPKTKGWKFQLDGAWLLRDADAKMAMTQGNAEAVLLLQKRELIPVLERYWDHNTARMKGLFRLFTASILFLGIEATGFMIDLTV